MSAKIGEIIRLSILYALKLIQCLWTLSLLCTVQMGEMDVLLLTNSSIYSPSPDAPQYICR
jgi:hypothetical protein